ncbi:MAG TPA: cytochrome c oxidase assembly protein [Phenylobacterium sp.]|jgi:cytochrome c oxidase assembly protein subunit 11
MSPAGPSRRALTAQERRNRLVGGAAGLVFVFMVGAAFAAVPLYRAFCQATGYDGTVSRASAAPDKVLADEVSVHFDVNVRDLPWDFTAEQASQPVKIGETKVAIFKVTNHADHPVTGRAVFNVVPEQSAVYFHKLSCFCFTDQTIAAHQTVEMPVLYFIDPKWMTDFETRTQKDVTLSYTFYPAVNPKPPVTARTSAAAPAT